MARRKCEGGCGRWLSSPTAVELGYGRVCAERHGITASRPRPASAPIRSIRAGPPPVDLHPGQTELPLQPMQPSLWSL